MTVDDDITFTRSGAFMIGGTAIQQQNSNQNKVLINYANKRIDYYNSILCTGLCKKLGHCGSKNCHYTLAHNIVKC